MGITKFDLDYIVRPEGSGVQRSVRISSIHTNSVHRMMLQATNTTATHNVIPVR